MSSIGGQMQQEYASSAGPSAGAMWLESTSATLPAGEAILQPGPSAGADAFGMIPWQQENGTGGVGTEAADLRRRTPSFAAAVGSQAAPAKPFARPQRRETYHAGQFPQFSHPSANRSGQDTAAVAPAATAVAVPRAKPGDRRLSTPVDAFGQAPFNVTDGPTSADVGVGVSPGGVAQPGLQQQDELLLFQQAQLKKQEAQLQIHISTLRRKQIQAEQDQRALSYQHQQQQVDQDRHQQEQHPQLASSMPAGNSPDMFGMGEFAPGPSPGQAPHRPASSNAAPPPAMDPFGMDRFSPSSSVPGHGPRHEFDGPPPRNPAATNGGSSMQCNQQQQQRPQSHPAGQQAPQVQASTSTRLARAAGELAPLNTSNATTTGTLDRGRPPLPRSPENLFRKMPVDGQTWHLMFKPVQDGMHQAGQASGKSRWTPALVRLDGTSIYVHEHNPLHDNRSGSAQPQSQNGFFPSDALAEVFLRHEMAFTSIERKRVDDDSRVRLHTVKLQAHNNQERRTLRHFMAVTHEPIRQTVLKLGSYDLLLLESFITDVLDEIRKMPIQMYQRMSFTKNEIFIDLVDRCVVMMDCYGVLKARSSTVQVMVQGFLSGMPECNLVINDTKIADQRRKAARGAVLMPVNQATIRMSGLQLHPSVDHDAYKKDLQLKFRCMEGVRYEAMRFMVAGSLPPPIRVTSNSIEVLADVVNSYIKLELQPHAGRVRHAIERLEWHFPVPGSWHNILVKKTTLGYRSVKSTESLLSSRSERITPHAMIDASVGIAKYEPENSAIVWRLAKFPAQAGTRVSLACHFQVQPGMTKTDFVNQYGMLRYTVAGSCVSGAQVWGLKFDPPPPKPVKKWVRYETDFRYQVDLRPPQQMLATPDD